MRLIDADYVTEKLNEINGTAELDKAFEVVENAPTVDVLEQIRAEILLRDKNVKDVRTDGHCFFTAEEILEIIDKYKAESEGI